MKKKMTDLNALWREVEAIPHPGPAPRPNERPVIPLPRVQFFSKLLMIRRIASYVAWSGFCLIPLLSPRGLGFTALLFTVVAIAFTALSLVLVISTETTDYEERLKAAEAEWSSAEKEWEEHAGSRSFENLKLQLTHTYSQWRKMGDLRAARIAELHEKHWHDQQHKFLSRFNVEGTKFYELARLKDLNLYDAGFHTAADVTDKRVESLSSTNVLIKRSLIEWRHSLESQFEFDPEQPMDPGDLLKFEEEMLAEGLELEISFEHYLADLHKASKRIHKFRARNKEVLDSIYQTYRQAEVNLLALKGRRGRIVGQPSSMEAT